MGKLGWGVLGGWVYLWSGFGLAVAALWRAQGRGSLRARQWAWGVQSLPIVGGIYLLLCPPRKKVLRSAFGVVERLPPEKRPFRLGWGLSLAGVVPGGAHLLLGRPGRAVAYWLLMGLAATLWTLQRADVRGSWKVPHELLPASRRNETVTVNFRVPGWLGKAMLVELGLLVPLTYFEALSLASAAIQKHTRRAFRAAAFYRLRVERPGAEPQESPVDRESLFIGSAESCDVVVPDAGVAACHASFYVHLRDDTWSVWVRCLEDDNSVLLNGLATHQAPLHPGDRVTLGKTTFSFLPL